MDDWWDYDEPPKVPENDKISWTQKICNHQWKTIDLINSKVSDCTKCKVKKEDWDEWQNAKT